jgi:hypothetical protein
MFFNGNAQSVTFYNTANWNALNASVSGYFTQNAFTYNFISGPAP